jgi:putative ABC transport system permease protein
VLLVSKELIKPVIIAMGISIPLAWYAMHRWLEGFAYRMQMNIGIFLAAGLVATLIAMITVGWRATRAAKANPVKSLRTE